MSDTNEDGENSASQAEDTPGTCGVDDSRQSSENMVRACALADLADDPAQRFDLVDAAGEPHRIAVIRIEESVYVIGDKCTHADVSLAAGDIDPDECSIECPRHGSTFLLETGVPTSMPAVKPVPVYTAEVIDGDVMVHLPVEVENSPAEGAQA